MEINHTIHTLHSLNIELKLYYMLKLHKEVLHHSSVYGKASTATLLNINYTHFTQWTNTVKYIASVELLPYNSNIETIKGKQ